jgi:hypothetical protein
MHDKIHVNLGRDTRYFALVINNRDHGRLMNLKEHNGTICGLFSGYRFIKPKDL